MIGRFRVIRDKRGMRRPCYIEQYPDAHIMGPNRSLRTSRNVPLKAELRGIHNLAYSFTHRASKMVGHITMESKQASGAKSHPVKRPLLWSSPSSI